jgi:4-hydroxybenzoate polyprenyltransferase
MSVQQKQAWFTLALCIVALAAYAALLPTVGPDRAWGIFGIVGLVGVPPLLARLRKEAVLLDERDELIARRARLITLRIFWVCFVATCLGTYWTVTEVLHRQVVAAGFLFALVIGAWVLYQFCHSVAILALYRSGQAHEA